MVFLWPFLVGETNYMPLVNHGFKQQFLTVHRDACTVTIIYPVLYAYMLCANYLCSAFLLAVVK